MRPALLALLLILVPACGAEDPYPLRPPGGGSGTGSNAPDAGGDDDAGAIDAGLTPLDGTVCVILDVADPFECPISTLAAGVAVAAVASGTSAISDADGLFTIDVTVTNDVLQIGATPADGLVTTVSRTNLTPEPVTAPVLEEGLRDSIYANLTEVQTTGAMLVYVRDSLGPVAGATITAGGRVYYDDGAGAFVDDAAGTGNDGIVLIIDTDSDTLTATEGLRSGNAAISTVIGGFGIGVITLPDL